MEALQFWGSRSVLLALGLFTCLFLGAIRAPYMVITGLVLVLAGWLIYLHRDEETDRVE